MIVKGELDYYIHRYQKKSEKKKQEASTTLSG